jgi:hypothetical protein
MVELINTAAGVGTFLVIAVTAVAAMFQLRHLRASNQIAAIQYAVDTFNSPRMQQAIAFVFNDLERRLQDPAYREDILRGVVDTEHQPERLVCNFQEQMGTYVYHKLIPFDIYMDVAMATPQISDHPDALYEYFEWLAIKARAYAFKYRAGVLRGRLRRAPVHTTT